MRIFSRKKKRNPRRSGIRASVPIRRRSAWTQWLALSLALVFSTGVILAQKKNKGEEQNRTVQGTVTTEAGTLAVGAEVQLKNTKNLQIRSYVTQKEGTYFFHGLSPDVDYEVKAQYNGVWSSTKTVSSFDSHKDVTLDLKIKK
ncbi:MAG: carboxypeptidase-like regulatory domain-containing protein [Bryobacteraceae bacterium]|jgi:Carboxypeptidase regulatory-like domain